MGEKIDWYIRGEYLETCNCDVACPCLISDRNQNEAMPTYGHCDLMCSYHVDEGRYNGIDLSGLSHIIMCYTPREMKWHDWSMAHYYHNNATPEQREAMLAIFKGKAAPAEDLNAAMSEDLGTTARIYHLYAKKEAVPPAYPAFISIIPKRTPNAEADEYVKLKNLHPQCFENTPLFVWTAGGTITTWSSTTPARPLSGRDLLFSPTPTTTSRTNTKVYWKTNR
jgi:hypothetical protein